MSIEPKGETTKRRGRRKKVSSGGVLVTVIAELEKLDESERERVLATVESYFSKKKQSK